MDYEREEGKALACCATLEADTVIEVEMEIDEDAYLATQVDFLLGGLLTPAGRKNLGEGKACGDGRASI